MDNQMMNAIKLALRAKRIISTKRKHNVEQTKAADLERFAMTSSFAGKLLQEEFASLEMSPCICSFDHSTHSRAAGVASLTILIHTLRQNPRTFDFPPRLILLTRHHS
jgi:hypothetical protein